MSEQQIKEYLQKYNITSKELLASHIEELKRNTKPNTRLISELVWVLNDFYFSFLEHISSPSEKVENKYKYFINNKEVDNRTDYLNATMSGDYVTYFDGDSVFSVSFNSFFGENTDNNKMIKREINGHLSDTINNRLEYSKSFEERVKENTDKCQVIEKPFFLDEVIKASEISAEKTDNEEFLIYDSPSSYRDINKFTMVELDTRNKLHCIPTDATNIEVFHLDTKDNGDKTAFIGFKIRNGNFSFVEVPFTSPKVAEKENKTEENLVFPKDSEIHKEVLPPHQPLDFLLLLTDWVDMLSGTKNRPETFIANEAPLGSFGKRGKIIDYSVGIKEPQTTEAYKETEGKLFYELDWSFITQMAERMASNKKDSKYSLWNWKNPMTPKGIEDLKQATLRHLLEVLEGRYEDDGRPFGHIEAISDNMMMINYQLKNNG